MNQGKDVRTRVIETLQKYKVKQIDVARQTGMHHSTLCLWLQGKIRGHQVKIEETLERWLENFNENKPQIPKGLPTKNFGGKPSENKDAAVEVEKVEPILQNLVREDEIIPVRIDVESEGRRFRENICWNVNETQITPEHYAKQVADDNGLPPVCESEIALSIKKAMQAYRKYVPLLPEMIKVIELDIRVENICLKDRFEWDINDPTNVPEEFALNLCNELGLDFEFLGLISHSIREQIQTHQRQALDRGFAEFGNREDMFLMKKSTRALIDAGSSMTKKTTEHVVINEDNYLRNIPPENAGYQFEVNNQNVWEPRIEVLDLKDIERMKKLEERKNRYEKRHR